MTTTAMRPRRGYIDTAFGQVHYWTQESAGPRLFLFHTSPLSGAEYAGLFAHLRGRQRAVAFDNPGYGMSAPPPQPATLEGYAAPLCAAIEALGAERFALAGGHTGAAIALYAADHFGDRVTHVVFTGLPYFAEEDVTYFRTNTTRPSSSTDGSHLAEAWRRMKVRWGADTDAATFEWALACGLLATDRAAGPTHAVFDYDMAGALRRLRGKVLFLNGPHDPLLKYDHRALPLVPQARLELIDAPAGVSPAHAAPANYAAALLRFLES